MADAEGGTIEVIYDQGGDPDDDGADDEPPVMVLPPDDATADDAAADDGPRRRRALLMVTAACALATGQYNGHGTRMTDVDTGAWTAHAQCHVATVLACAARCVWAS